MPIYKNGNKEEPLHYRPVSLTSIVCRICEKIKKQWTEYLERIGIIKDLIIVNTNKFDFEKKSRG